ncbi:MAG: HlyD family secretion protein [Silvibacterium sp.]|nr:HlyD family secretion protein [Silvibacterium sp.]
MILEIETEPEASAAASVDGRSEPEPVDREFEPEPTGTAAPRRRVNPLLIGGVLIVLLGAGISWYLYARGFESTDDAQVDGHLNPIAARIDGTIKVVHVEDNQRVESGTLLVELDPGDNQIALEQAQAQHDQAMAQLNASHPNLPMTVISNRGDLTSRQDEVAVSEAALAAAQHDLESAEARLKESQAVSDQDQADFARFQSLFDEKLIPRADYEHSRAAAAAQAQTVLLNQAAVASAQKLVDQRRSQLAEQRAKLQQTESSAPLQVAIREADIKSQQANEEATHAALEKSRLNLTYCRIEAPVGGVITQRSAEVGARISVGQQLFMIVQTDDLWVTANFKETQLARMHPGQRVRIKVDALRRSFDGTVESMPAVTGSRTSVLPPENATGNYVKVVQRLPVRIRFNAGQKDLDKLRPGMSVEPKVYLD